jgi:peroxiredoxin
LDRKQTGPAEVRTGGAALTGVLDVGAIAPDFTLKDQDGRPVTLSAHQNAKDVLLVFFPLAFTGTCQRELDEIQHRLADYVNEHTATLAISVGPAPTHKVWARQSGFTFPVLSDFWPHGAVAQAYGVFNGDAGFANRGTFVIDRAGVVRFAEMNGPGEPRDQAVWTDALAALRGR